MKSGNVIRFSCSNWKITTSGEKITNVEFENAGPVVKRIDVTQIEVMEAKVVGGANHALPDAASEEG